MKLIIRRSVIALTMAGLTMTTVHAQAPANVKEIRNELGIMLNILQASLRQNSSKNLRLRAESVTYLADQGVVFNIDANNHNRFSGIDLSKILSNVFIPSVPPVPPVAAPGNGNNHIQIDIDGEGIENTIRAALDMDEDFVDESSDKMRELNERQRDLSWEQREYERNSRDLEFEKRNSESERRQEIEKEMAELATKLKKIEGKRAELEEYSKQLAKEQSQFIAEREAAKKVLYQQTLAIFEETAGSMLCSYGAGLKSLPDDENISFVLNEFVEAEKDSVLRNHDKVYVFKYKDVKACVMGKNNKEQLLANAITYLF